MRRTYFLIVTAVAEGTAGLVFLFVPAVLLTLLLGESAVTPDATFYFRIFGAGLIALSVAWWLVRNHHGRPAQVALLIAALIYDVSAAALLAYLGSVKGMAGIALWPAVALHTVLAIWGVVSLRDKPLDGTLGLRAEQEK